MDKIIAVDFDGTIVEDNFPSIGKPLPYALETIRALRQQGWIIILWTLRTDIDRDYQKLTECLLWCKENDLYFDYVNEQDIRVRTHPLYSKSYTRKVHATYYIDDRIIGGFPGWLTIACELLPANEFQKLLIKQ